MKCRPLVLAGLFLAVTLHPGLSAQEISLAEALDSSGISWSVHAGALPGSDPFQVADENYWHPVSDESQNGGDSLHVRMADGQTAFTSLNALIPAPVQFSFWYKTDPEEAAYLHTYWVKEGTTQGNVADILRSEEWAQYTTTVREETNIFLSINVNSFSAVQDWDAWIDHFQVKTAFPPEVLEFPETVGALLGKQTTIHVEVEAFGNVSYKWFRNDTEVPGETGAGIIIPAENEVGEAQYKVEVTDSLGSVLSPTATVRFFDINEALDNDDLVFQIEDSLSGSYSEMVVTGEDAYDGEDAIYLERLGRLRDPKYHQTSRSITTNIEGPTILKFRFRDIIAVRLNGENPNASFYEYNYSEEEGDWTIVHLPIPEGNNEVEFMGSTYNDVYGGSGVLDQVELVTQPKVFFNATVYSRLEGSDIPIYYTFVTAGDTTHQLIKGEDVVATSENKRVSLPAAQLSDTGVYKVRIVNEFEEEAFSGEFEIKVHEGELGNALEQPDLLWTTEGQDPWIAQIHQTYDGEDAVERVPWITPSIDSFPIELQNELQIQGVYDRSPPKLRTTITGPAYLSFWWRGGFFDVNDRESWLNESDHSKWSKASILLSSETNALSWDSNYLDRIQIELLHNDPFRFWAFNHFDSEAVLNNFNEILEGDDDFDGWSNFLEWALNKNLSFPNATQSYEIIEEDGQLYLGITFSRRGNLGQYAVYLEASNDMNTWEKIASVVSETYHASNDTYTVTIRDTKPVREGSRFIRLVVTDEL